MILDDEALMRPPAPTLPPRERQTWDDYLAINAMNWSTLKHMAVSPLMLRWRREHARPDTAALRRGRAIHCAVFEPERFEDAFTPKPDFGDGRTKAAKAAKAEWLADLPHDVDVLDADEYDLVRRCADAVLAHSAAADLLRGGRAEETVTWVDPGTGVPCKARLDYVTPEYLVDLKSTRRADLRAIWADFARFLYHGQLGMYGDGAERARVMARASRFAIAVQSVEPFDVVVARMPGPAVERGQQLYRGLLRDYAACAAADYWPGLAPGVIDMELPAWAPGADEPEGDDW